MKKRLCRNLWVTLLVLMIISMSSTVIASEKSIFENESMQLYKFGLYKGISADPFNFGLRLLADRETGIEMLMRLIREEQKARNLDDRKVNQVFTSPENIVTLPDNLKVIKLGSNIYISYRYLKNTDMHLVFGKCGVNNLMGIKAIYFDTNSSKEVSPYITKRSICFMEACTDWISPYVVESLEHDDGGQYCFTGGWHGNKINGKEEPTAKTEGFSFKIKGKELEDNKLYVSDCVEITATNFIQAYNTKDIKVNVLEEIVKYKITPKKINVEVVFTALEKALLKRYYGLQTQNTQYKGVEYSNGISSDCMIYSDSGPYNKSNIADSFTLISKSNLYRMIVTLENGYGLGDFGNLSNEKPTIFTENYGKTYFNLVNGIDKILNKGDSAEWKGSYEFN